MVAESEPLNSLSENIMVAQHLMANHHFQKLKVLFGGYYPLEKEHTQTAQTVNNWVLS